MTLNNYSASVNGEVIAFFATNLEASRFRDEYNYLHTIWCVVNVLTPKN